MSRVEVDREAVEVVDLVQRGGDEEEVQGSREGDRSRPGLELCKTAATMTLNRMTTAIWRILAIMRQASQVSVLDLTVQMRSRRKSAMSHLTRVTFEMKERLMTIVSPQVLTPNPKHPKKSIK